MAEPARRLDGEEQSGRVYDQPGNKPDLKALEGGGESSEPKSGHLREAGSEGNEKVSRENLSSAEENAGGNSRQDAAPTDGSQTNHVYHPGKPLPSRFSIRGRLTKKRALFGGGIAGFIISLFLLIILSGPAQIVQLGELLQHNFTKSQSDSGNRTTHLLRDFKAIKKGDYRYTRVGLIGAKVVARVVGQFEDAGVKFTGSDVLGRPTGIEVDKGKVAENNPDVKDLNSKEFDDWLNEKFDLDPGTSFENGKLDISGLKSQAIKSFIGNASTEILGDNAVETAVKTRSLKKFFGLGSLFHPFSTAIQNKIAAKAAEIKKQKSSESDSSAEAEAASDIEDETYNSNVATIEEPGVESFGAAKEQEDSFSTKIGAKLLPGAGLLWATGCTLKGVSGAVVSMNRYLTVLPAAVEATSLVADGSQVQNGGSDITQDQLGATEKGFTNNAGQSIWAGAALESLEGSSQANALPKNAKGKIENDLPGEYKQAFGTDSTASTISSVGDLMLTWFPFHWISSIVPGGECGFISGITITVAGVFAQAILGIINLPDGEVGDAATQAAAQAGEDVAINTIQGQLLSPLINNVVDRIARAIAAPKLARDAFSGPIGGNLIAYGARAASNSSSILNGGLALGNATSTIIGSAGQEQQQQFNSEGTFAKIFNINDYRSLLGHFATLVSPNPITNIHAAASSIFNVGASFASVFSHLIPHAVAVNNSNSWTGNYNWGFPQYGIPDNMLNDPALSDPYQNSEAVGQYLSSVCKDGNNIGPNYGACGGSGGYTERIMSCFGNSLTYSFDSDINRSVWDVTHAATATSNDVNPVSDTYQKAGCDAICPNTIAGCSNSGEENWEKIVMFVNDAWNIKALDCLGGYTNTSNQSCADVDAEGSNGAESGQGTGQGITSPSGLVNPLSVIQKNGSLHAERVDQGVDYSGSGPILALGSGTILSTRNSGWPGGTFIVIKLDAYQDKYVYVAENCQNILVQVGQHVNAGDKLCTLVNASPNMEIGWADGQAIGDAAAHDVWPGHDSDAYYTAYGKNFSDLLKSLGAPAGTIAPGAKELGSLPAGWPSW